jgi:hypothetical protein
MASSSSTKFHFLAVNDLVMFNMAEKKTAKVIWDKLHAIYEGKSMLNRIHLWRNLYSLRMKESSSFQEHLNEFNALVSKLIAIGVNLD